MSKHYKRNISLMDPKLFPRTSLDTPFDNPDIKNSVTATPREKSDQEIVKNVVSSLKQIGEKKTKD